MPAGALAFLILCSPAKGAVPGIDLYQTGKFPEAYNSFEEDLKNHPDAAVRDKMQFDAGTAAYKMRDYNKALESFSNALLSKDRNLQETSHYNIGRTLEERADMGKTDEESLTDLEDAKSHYEEALKLKPDDEAAKANLEEVKKKIERLKKRRKQTPTPPPRSQQQQKNNKDQQGANQKNNQNQSSQQNQQQQQSQDQSQSQEQSQSGAESEFTATAETITGKERTTKRPAAATTRSRPLSFSLARQRQERGATTTTAWRIIRSINQWQPNAFAVAWSR